MSQDAPLLVTLDTNVILALANDEPAAPAVRDLIELQAQGTVKLRIDKSFALERQPHGVQRSLQDQVAYLRALGFGDAEYLAGPTSNMWFHPEGEPHATFWNSGLRQAVVEAIGKVIHPNIPFFPQPYLEAMCTKHEIAFQDMLAANWDRYTRLSPWVAAPPHQLDAATVRHLRSLWEQWSQDWMNKKNDALALYNHVTWGGAVFVTSDNDILKRRAQLRRLVLQVNVLEEGPDGYFELRPHEVTFCMPSEILRPFDAVAYLREKTRSNLDEQ
jgi:hypothetical protein